MTGMISSTHICAILKSWIIYPYWRMVINPLIGIHIPITYKEFLMTMTIHNPYAMSHVPTMAYNDIWIAFWGPGLQRFGWRVSWRSAALGGGGNWYSLRRHCGNIGMGSQHLGHHYKYTSTTMGFQPPQVVQQLGMGHGWTLRRESKLRCRTSRTSCKF